MESNKATGWIKIHVGIEPVFLNMKHAVRVYPHGHGSLIACSDGTKVHAEENPDRIFALMNPEAHHAV